MTNYVTTIERYGRPENVFDMAAFAKDLAAALGGKVLERDADRIGSDRDDIEVDGVRIWLSVKGWGAGANTKVHVWAARPADGLRYNEHPYGDGYKLPDAYVTATRPMPAIAKDVRRRVVEAAKPVIAKWREHAAAVTKRGEDLVATAERLRELGLAVRVDEGATRTGSLHGYGMYGEFYADGSVNLRSMNLNAAAFAAVVAALANGKEE
jgi:hypothetical protein